MTGTPIKIAMRDARARAQTGDCAQPLTHGSMRAVFHAPRGADTHMPHTQDEIYVVVSGRGVFERDGEHESFVAGDLLFVRAGAPHRFVEFTKDFACWAVFWGPRGGEAEALV